MRRVGKGFLGVETPLFASMLVQPLPQEEEEEAEDEIPNAPTPPSPTNAPSPPLQDHTPTPYASPLASPLQEQPSLTTNSSMSLLTTLMETYATLSNKVAQLEQDKHTQALEILKLKKRVQKLEKKRKSKHSGFKRLRKGRIDQDVSAATKDVSAAEPTVFDDEERLKDEEIEKAAAREKKENDDLKRAQVLQKKYQSLKKKLVSIAQARKNMIICLKNMAGYKMEHFRGMTYDKVRPIFEREYKKVQTLFKHDKDVEEPKKKRVAKETLLQESFKKLKAVEVSGSNSTQETPSNDTKEISEKDVQNMLKIAPVSEFKVEALQVELKRLFKPDADDVLWKLQRYMHYPITWKLYTNCGVHQVSSTTKRHDMFMLIEKDYPLSNGVTTLMLSAKLQVEEDSEMARDLVMKIFMEANKPKSKSLDTSSK
nr:hypothetical protein [Tanacetum cinerariifolium]